MCSKQCPLHIGAQRQTVRGAVIKEVRAGKADRRWVCVFFLYSLCQMLQNPKVHCGPAGTETTTTRPKSLLTPFAFLSAAKDSSMFIIGENGVSMVSRQGSSGCMHEHPSILLYSDHGLCRPASGNDTDHQVYLKRLRLG